jgi:hypothetical protein
MLLLYSARSYLLVLLLLLYIWYPFLLYLGVVSVNVERERREIRVTGPVTSTHQISETSTAFLFFSSCLCEAVEYENYSSQCTSVPN